MTFLERLQSSFAQFAEFVPALFGALIILFAGYLLAKLIERGTEKLFRRMRLNYLLERGGVMQAVERSGSHFNPSRVLANLVFWFVMFVVIMIAANALGMETLADVFSELVGYIPSMMAAIVLLIVGIVLGRFVGADSRVGRCDSGWPDAGARRSLGRDRPRDLHGAPATRHRERDRGDGVRDSLRCRGARARIVVRARQPGTGG